jgi:hypothetical protein
MTSLRASRTPLLPLLVVGSLALVACSADSGDVVTSPYHHGGYGSGGGSSSTGSGSSSQGGSASTGGGSASTGSTSSGNGATSGNTTGSTGSTGTGSTGTGSTGTGSTGTGGTTTPPPPAAPTYNVAVDNAAPSLDLASTATVKVTVTSTNEWSGTVSLAALQLPSDVTGTFDNASVAITPSTPGTATLTLKSIDSSSPVATPFEIDGTVSSVVEKAMATVTVNSVLTVDIPVNVSSLGLGLGTYSVTAPANIASNPVTIKIKNLDSTPHEIHADNPDQGFPHGAGTFGQGQEDTPRMVTAAGTYKFHLHDTNTNDGQITIQ